MGLFEKLYTLLIAASVILGLLVGNIGGVESFADHAILPLLMVMLYVTFLQIPMKDMKRSFANRKFTVASIAMNFVLTPVIAWLLASVFLADSPALALGFFMLMVTPCTDWYIIFTGLAKGNVALSTSILPLNVILQLGLLPLYLYVVSGSTGVVDFRLVLESIVLVFVLPFVFAYGSRRYLLKRERAGLLDRFSSFPIVFLCLAIVAMFASQGSLLLSNLDLLATLIVPILAFFFITFIAGRVVGNRLAFGRANTASLNLTTLARNSPTALAIAMTAFPHEPLIALVLVIGPLIELPLLSLISHAIVWIDDRKTADF